MAICPKCKRPLPNAVKACYFCGKLTPEVVGTPEKEKKEVPAPKRSADEAIFATTTAAMAQKKGAGKTAFRIVLVAVGLILLFLVGKEAMVLFDGSSDEPRRKVFYDPVNGLLWQRSPTVPMNYEDAARYCEKMQVGAMAGWRLPTIDELRTLVKGCTTTGQTGTCQIRDDCLSRQCRGDECAGCGERGGPGEEGLYWEKATWDHEEGMARWFYWSSSAPKEAAADESWVLSFVSGGITAQDRDTGGHVRCVQGPAPLMERLRLYLLFRK